MEKHGAGGNVFMENWKMRKKRRVFGRFKEELDEEEHVPGTEIAVIMAGVRQLFLVNAHSVGIFEDPTVLAARKAAWTTGARETAEGKGTFGAVACYNRHGEGGEGCRLEKWGHR